WSSDVCSSDLAGRKAPPADPADAHSGQAVPAPETLPGSPADLPETAGKTSGRLGANGAGGVPASARRFPQRAGLVAANAARSPHVCAVPRLVRHHSAEHGGTSESATGAAESGGHFPQGRAATNGAGAHCLR